MSERIGTITRTDKETLLELIRDLERENESLGGKLLVKMPISAKDDSQVLLFSMGESRRNGSRNRRIGHLFGVHPEKGRIQICGTNMPHSGLDFCRGTLESSLEQLGLSEKDVYVVDDNIILKRWGRSYLRSEKAASDMLTGAKLFLFSKNW